MTAKPSLRWILSRSRDQRRRAVVYWIHHPLVGLAKNATHYALRCLPTNWVSDFGAFMSRFSRLQYPRSEARARKLWQVQRPGEADPASTDAAMRRLWRCVGRTMAEITVLERLWDEGRVEVEGAEHMAAARDAGRPILPVAVHVGNWEVISVTGIKLGYHGACLALVLENRFEQRLIGRLRERFGGRMVHATATSGRAMVRELQERGPLVIYIDDYSRGRVHAPAFGRPLRPEGNIAYAVRLARLTGAAMIPVYCTRLGDEARFRVTFLPEEPVSNSGDAEADLEADVARLNALIEPIIRARLDQWFYALDFEFGS